MQYVVDLHLHSKYSRAVSKDMVLPIMADFAVKKGFDILSASDWTHPLWIKEIRAQLEEASEGVYKLKGGSVKGNPSVELRVKGEREILFLLSTEIASIYTQGGKLRRIHNLVIVPSFETVEKINAELRSRGCNLNADGRPIIGISSRNLLEMILEIDERSMLIPCHAWTPHFGIYGSASGFDSLSEAFGDLEKYIYGIETGLSSDPEMNWQMSELNNRSILSFSDAHSPGKMGREATVFELSGASYENIRRAIMRRSVNGKDACIGKEIRQTSPKNETGFVADQQTTMNRIVYTIEFYPEEGKYHFSGHRNCKVVFGPEDIKEKGTTCPVCKRRLTEGVLLRVQQLGDQDVSKRLVTKTNSHGLKWYTDATRNHPPYVKLVPLLEIIAESMESTAFSQKVKDMFGSLCNTLGSEIDVLLKVPIEEIARVSNSKIAEGVGKIRSGDLVIEPGYDGEYGKVKIWGEHEEEQETKDVSKEEKEQLGLF